MSFQCENSDKKILHLIQLENKLEEGFRLLMAEHQERVYSQVRGMIKNHDDSADVVQNVFIKVYKAIKKFEGKSKISTWIYRITVNECLTFLKQKRKMNIDRESNEHLSGMKADSFIQERDIITLLGGAIDSLPTRQKMVFNMRYFEELTYEEMSQILDLKVGGLKASFHHAVKKIETFVKENQVR